MTDDKLKKKILRMMEKHQLAIPDEYNPNDLLPYLIDKEVDHIFSISNRTDGKTFNYTDFLIEFSRIFGFKFMLIGRHYTLRQLMLTTIIKIYTKKDNRNLKDLVINRTDFYIEIYHREVMIGIITDLNAVSDLKIGSQMIEDFPIVIYDEFLALEEDYLPDEYDRIRVLYSSIDRKGELPIIGHPKIFYMGNAVNFDSPILAGFDMYEILESHPINTHAKYGKIALEMRRNDKANKKRNLRAFDEEEDAMTTGEFNFNTFMILKYSDKPLIKTRSAYFFIKLEKYCIQVYYPSKSTCGIDKGVILLKIVSDLSLIHI